MHNLKQRVTVILRCNETIEKLSVADRGNDLRLGGGGGWALMTEDGVMECNGCNGDK